MEADHEHAPEGEEPVSGYRWETEYEKTWEAIKENEDGLLQPTVEQMIQRNKTKRALERKNLRLGIMRHIYIVIDCSETMMRNDIKPTRFTCSLKLLEMFLNEFSDLNPISQIGIITTRNKRAELLSPLSSDMKLHLACLEKLKQTLCSGEPSLQNSLELACCTLRHMPNHTSKEVLVLAGSLTTCDPGDIHATIQTLSSFNIRCSVVGLSAEVKILKTLTTNTKGSYDVVIDDGHFKDVIFEHLNPPTATKETQSSLIKMGFSQYANDNEGEPSMCSCHLTGQTNFSSHGYYCPQCHAKYCDLPIECVVCGLTLVSAAHLARSFHHLFPVELFSEVKLETPVICSSCNNNLLPEKNDAAECTVCHKMFCLDCDIFIHETLHFCPSCCCIRYVAGKDTPGSPV